MKSGKTILTFLLLVISTTPAPSQDFDPSELKKPTITLMNINEISAWVDANGLVGGNPYGEDNEIIYPKGTASAVYMDGTIWGGFVRDGNEPELRLGGNVWSSIGMSPGAILSGGIAEDTASAEVRIWRIRRDWQTADLKADASEYFNVPIDSITQNQINDLRSQYERDWHEWPWQKGAPFYDYNDNGRMDSDEEPGLAHADQVVWLVANDLNSDSTLTFFGRPPIGMEMQTTLWAYDRTGSRSKAALQRVIFKQVKLIYKGRMDTAENAAIDSMFIGLFIDTEIGAYWDDLAGCDTTLQMGFGYNGGSLDAEYSTFDLAPPAFGYLLVRGPLVPSEDPSQMGRFRFGRRDGYTNLKMTSFWLHASGGANTPPVGSSEIAKVQLYHLMNGYYPHLYDQFPFIPMLDHNGNPTKFIASGKMVVLE